MYAKLAVAALFGTVLLFTACSSSSSYVSTQTPTPTAGAGQTTVPAGSTNTGGATVSAGSATVTSTPPGNTVSDPCSLLTPDEISAVIGQTVGAGVPATDSRTCEWTYHDPTDALTLVQVSVTSDINLNTFAQEQNAGSGNGITETQVSGVGDTAFFADAGSVLGNYLAFKSDNRAFETSVGALGNLRAAFDTATSEGYERVLALLVLAKI